MSTTVTAILTAARTLIAAQQTTRDSSLYFIAHVTNQPFNKAPISKREGFEIVARESTHIGGFGIHNEKEGQFLMVLKVGTPPFSTDATRENLVQSDASRLSDSLEAIEWYPSGLQSVFFESQETDKSEPNWWVTELRFRVVYFSAIYAPNV